MSRIVQTIVIAERAGVAVCHAFPLSREPALSAAKGRGARGEDRTRGGPQRLHCRDHGSLCVHAPRLCRRRPRPAGSGLHGAYAAGTRVLRFHAPAPPGAEPTSGVPVAAVESTRAVPAVAIECSAAARPDSPLLVYMRSRIGSTFPHVALVDERPTGYHGKEHIVVIRAMSTDSTYINFSIDVVNEAMTEGVRSVQIMTAPWPDFTLRIDRVTPDSVYLTGRSASNRRTVTRAYQWWPTAWKPPPQGRPQLAMAAPVCGDTLRVDLTARTIAGIWMNQSIADVRREVGAGNVITDTGYAEGTPVEEYVIKLCGHEVRRHWNGVSWSDPIFRTTEGLGVGSPLAAFDTAYGKGEAVGEEGNSVRYWPPDGGGHFFVDVSGGCYGMVARRWVVDRACRATDISFIVVARP